MQKKLEKLREMTTKELDTDIENLKKELFNLRFQQVQGQLENPRAIKKAKKSIAQMLTILKEKEIKGEKHADIVTKESA